MFELMQKMVAFKYSSKLNHWGTDSYAKHLLFDRLQEDIDDFVDKIAEEYFMSNNKKNDLNSSILEAKYINQDLNRLSKNIIEDIEKIMKKEALSQGTQSLLGAISEAFDEKLALLTLK